MQAADTAIEVTGLTKSFGGRAVVRDLSMRVKRGQIYGFLGPNGSGKTTTLNVLSGLYTATSGSVMLDGRDITKLPAHKRTEAGLGRTFQNIRLFRSMTALLLQIVDVLSTSKAGDALSGFFMNFTGGGSDPTTDISRGRPAGD